MLDKIFETLDNINAFRFAPLSIDNFSFRFSDSPYEYQAMEFFMFGLIMQCNIDYIS